MIEKHLINTTATAKGHLDQERKNLQSTKNTSSPTKDEDEDFFPEPDSPNIRTNDLCAIVVPFNQKSIAYSDLTGRFPYKSSRGNEYLLVVYDYDSNAILVEPLKNRAAKTITTAYEKIHTVFKNRGIAPKLYILDNEISGDFKAALKKNQVKFQLTPPHMHRQNAAERAIRTFKNHFLAGLATCDPKFPVAEWDRLLDQAVLTLNLLRSSRVNPQLSAHAYVFGNFDFNKTPLAPPGTKVVIHEKPQQRSSWAFHGVDGWYIGPSPNHYRCVRCFLPQSRRERDADTVSFHPHAIEFPAVSTLDYLKQASDDILNILCNPQQAFPYLEGGDQTKNAYVQIATLLNRAATHPASLSNTATLPRVQEPQLNPLPEPRVPIAPPPGFVPLQPELLPHAPLPRVQRPLPRLPTIVPAPQYHNPAFASQAPTPAPTPIPAPTVLFRRLPTNPIDTVPTRLQPPPSIPRTPIHLVPPSPSPIARPKWNNIQLPHVTLESPPTQDPKLKTIQLPLVTLESPPTLDPKLRNIQLPSVTPESAPTPAPMLRKTKILPHNMPLQTFRPVTPSLHRAVVSPTAALEKRQISPLPIRPTYQHPQRLQRQSPGNNFRSIASQFLMAQHMSQKENTNDGYKTFLFPTINHIYNDVTGKRENIDSLRQGKNKDIWNKALSNEWGRLAQGNTHGVVAQDALDFIHKYEIPPDRDITYAQFVCDHRPLKSEPWRVRIVAGGDRLSYPGDPASPAANLLETKIMLNSVISDAKKGARFAALDLKDYFLGSPMERPEYMRVHIDKFPPDIVEWYNLKEKVSDDGYIYIRIKKGMYGLKQAAILAYDNLVKTLAPHGYHPVPNTQGMWKHTTRPTRFCLCVDDFGVKYFSKTDLEHLHSALQTHYKCTIDWSGENYCGLNIKWNYKGGFVDISIKEYIKKLLKKLQHEPPTKKVYSPHEWQAPIYGKHRQYVKDPDSSPLLDKDGTHYVQSVVGSLLYYGRAIEHPLLVGLNEISVDQASPTQKIKQKCQRLLDYAATYPDAVIRFYASDMILHVESDAAYLVLPNAKSRIGGYFYMSSHPPKNPATIPKPQPNGPILIECATLKHVVASAAEAETGGLFRNGQTAVVIRVILEALDHKQPPTPLKTDNSTATGFANSHIRQKRSKSWDMRYQWLRCRENQKQLRIYWDKGKNNTADYYTKHFPPKHHREMRKQFFHLANCITRIVNKNLTSCLRSVRRGCVDPPRIYPLTDVSICPSLQ